MKPIMQKLGVTVAMIAIYLSASASTAASTYDFEVGGIYYKITDAAAKEVEVTTDSLGSYSGEIVVPSSVAYNGEDYSVTSIGDGTFIECSELTSITIPNTVTSIGDGTFIECSGLTSIILSDSVTAIGERTFYNCSSLTTITIPSSVTTIGNGAFSGCSGLTTITLPNTLTTIGERSFTRCSSLTTITLPNSVTTIGESVFIGCSSLTSITIPDKVTAIGNSTFTECSSLASITIPNSVTSIGDDTFTACSSLTTIEIPNSVTTIGNRAFNGCSGLTSITIPNGVTTIGIGTFYDCVGLTTIEIPNTVTTIGGDAFNGCIGLTSIEIPNSVTTIGNYTFSGCSSLTNIDVADDNQAYSSKDGVLYNKLQTTLVCYPEGKAGDFIIPNTVTTFKSDIFTGCRNLTDIGVADENQAYSSKDGILYDKSQETLICCPCGKAGEIIIPNSVTSIGGWAFANCVGLTTITLPGSVTTIGDVAFFGCRGLTSITSLAGTPPECSNFVFDNVDKQKCVLYVPAGSVEAYRQAPWWKDFNLVEEAKTGIDSIEAGDAAGVTEVFNLAGEKVADTPDNLPAGIYIVREGMTSRKIVVR